jgi:hypothetical protein
MQGIDQRVGEAVAISGNYDQFKSYLYDNLKIKE